MLKDFKPAFIFAWIAMVNDVETCLQDLDESFLKCVDEFLRESDLREKIRKLSRAEGYLRYLFFELVGHNMKDLRGGDLKTLICGLSYLIVQGVKLCYETDNGDQEIACGISRDILDLTFSLMMRWRRDETLLKLGAELWTRLDPENLGEREETVALSLEVARAILNLLG
ncbi:MAG TPA: hypothetical protein ENF57_02965 [Candidatus Korarchaeota archaeon]|nr:hypothetical protein [Candidatus Korarchaeota archaeon]